MNKRLLVTVLFVLCGYAFAKAQSTQLAQNYYDQGQFEKALLSYQKILKIQPTNAKAVLGTIESYQQLEKYEEADAFITKALETPRSRMVSQLIVEKGYNYQRWGKDSLAAASYGEALRFVEASPNYAYTVGKAFQDHTLLEQAAQIFEVGNALKPSINYSIQLARIYGELGEIEKMYRSFLELVELNPAYLSTAQRNFAQYITEDGDNEANQIFRKLLLKKLQAAPNLMYNELLSWLFIQQNDYNKAFVQEKAIVLRREGDLQGVINLAQIAIEGKDWETSKKVLNYISEQAVGDQVTQANAQLSLVRIDAKFAKTDEEKQAVRKTYEALISRFTDEESLLSLNIDYAHFIAFEMGDTQTAISYLKKETKTLRNRFDEARLKMELADILVLEEKFNQALIYYSQIQNKVKNTGLAQEARFKVAKTSYYKGDFKWAETQLDVLKASATQLIANDALELLLTIRDNSQEDSLQVALQKFAKADLLAYQRKPEAAIVAYEEILQTHKGESIEDEALLAQATLYEDKASKQTDVNASLAKAEKNYRLIIEFFGDGVIADDAHYRLAELYANQLNQPEKAKALYEKIIFNFADSIFYVEAQRKFRTLRGDLIN